VEERKHRQKDRNGQGRSTGLQPGEYKVAFRGALAPASSKPEDAANHHKNEEFAKKYPPERG
jgi:hypothetical protein